MKVVIAIATTKQINIPLAALLDSARRKEGACWGSTEIRIRPDDPSISIVEEAFRCGTFATLHWCSKSQLFDSANYAILASRRSILESNIKQLKQKTGVKRFKTYSIP